MTKHQSTPKVPKLVKPWLEAGYDYLGVNDAGEFFLTDEYGLWRLTTTGNGNERLDHMGDGLPPEELAKLKR